MFSLRLTPNFLKLRHDHYSQPFLFQNNLGFKTGWLGCGAAKREHIRLQKHTRTEVLKLTIPAHTPLKRSTLTHILKQAGLSVEDFLALL